MRYSDVTAGEGDEMAQQSTVQSVASLRAITYRISSTPTKELPHIAHQIAASLWNCKDLLSAPQQTTKSQSEISTLVHRFKTSLSNLLQDRTIEGRWAAVVLVKAAIEAGGVEILSKSGAWIKSLLSISKRPGPSTTRNLAIISLTRIFMLTWDYTNLVRELTTPNLPTFVTSCLSNVETRDRCSANELQTILEAFATLIPRHPTIFRTHEGLIRTLLLRILSSTSSNIGFDIHYTKDHIYTAQRLVALLHHCAPKQGSAEKWNETVRVTVSSAHETCDRLLRSVVEDWRSNSGTQPFTNATPLSAGEIALESPDALGLFPWKGVFSGSERLVILLGILRSHVDTVTADAVNLPIGLMVDLLTRLLEATPAHSDKDGSVKINVQIAKDERESMFSILPDIHVATLQLIKTILTRFGTSIISILPGLLEPVVGLCISERHYVHVRATAYETIERILNLTGPSLSKDDVAELGPAVKACCNDLLPVDGNETTTTVHTTNSVAMKQSNPTGNLSQSSTNTVSSHPTQFDDLRLAAESLLTVFFSKIDPVHMPRKVRAQIERTAILTRHRGALVAAVMNPARKESGIATETSLLPLLAGLSPDSDEIEAILRPKMPLISPRDRPSLNGEEAAIIDNESVANGYDDDDLQDLPDGVENHSEPGEDLLSALEANVVANVDVVERDEFYDATPRSSTEAISIQLAPRVGLGSARDNSHPAKRVAAEPADESVSAKRLRATSVAEALEPEFASSLRGPDPAAIETSLPVTVAVNNPLAETESSEHTATFSQHPTADASGISSTAKFEPVTIQADDDDDGSDMEIPELNMEPDTDPEEENDVGEDGEH